MPDADAVARRPERCLLGWVLERKGGLPVTGARVVVARTDGSLSMRWARVGGDGRFLLRFDDDMAAGLPVDLVVRDARRGTELARQRVAVPAGGCAVAAEITVYSTAGSPAGPSVLLETRPTLKPARAGMVLLAWRSMVAKLLTGRQPDKAGVPLVPASINRHIAGLHELSDVARRILGGDVSGAKAFGGLIGFDGATSGLVSGAGSGRGYGSAPAFGPRSGAGLGALPDRGGAGGIHGGDPCIFSGQAAVEVALAGLYLDAYRADALGDLTQPGAHADLATRHLLDAHRDLRDFSRSARSLAEGRLSSAAFEKRVFADEGSLDPEPFDMAGIAPPLRAARSAPQPGPLPGPAPGGSGSLGGGFDGVPGGGVGGVPGGRPGSGSPGLTPEPGRPPSLDRGLCLDIWPDCVDEIVRFARGYRPPGSCSSDDTIGSVTPSAVCAGDSDVELVIKPVDGEEFAGDAVSCRLLLQRGMKRTTLDITAFAKTEVRATLPAAERSGCLGFRGGSGGSAGASPGTILSCLKAARIQNRALEGLLTPGIGSLRGIDCTGRNQLSVVGEPRIRRVSVAWDEGSTEVLDGADATLVAEACQPVTIAWAVDFGVAEQDWLAPSTFIRVAVTDADGQVVVSSRPPVGSLVVDAAEAQTYTITATALVDGTPCATIVSKVTVERYLSAHVTGPLSLRSGDGAALDLSISCPAPAGGLPLVVSATPSDRLAPFGAVLIPAGATSVSAAVRAIGPGCDDVTVRVDADGHLQGRHTIDVFDAPVLTAVAPTSVPACRPFQIALSGSCFEAGQTIVRLRRGSLVETLDITAIMPNAITATGSDLAPGTYELRVTSRGLDSEILSVVATAPVVSIQQFDAVLVGAYLDGDGDGDIELVSTDEFIPCVPNIFDVRYDVRRARRVTIWRDDEELADIDLGECGGDVNNSLSIGVEHGSTLRLEATPVGGGGGVVDAEIMVGGQGSKTLVLRNGTTRDLVIWNISGVYPNAADIPHGSPKQDLSPDGEVSVSFEECVLHHVIAIDKQAALAADRDPYGDAIEIGSLRQWETTYVGDTDGETQNEQLVF